MTERDVSEWTETLALWVFLAVFTFILPSLALYVFGGAEESVNLTKFFFYTSIGLVSALLYTVIKGLDHAGYFEEREALKPLTLMSPHAPETTIAGTQFGAVSEVIRDPKRLAFYSLVISILFGTLVSVSGTFMSGIPQFTEGQITESAQLSLAVEPAVSSETLFFNMVLLFLQTAGVAYLLIRELDVSFDEAVIAGKFISVVLTTVEFFAYHRFRYGAAEADQLGVLFLGFTTNTLTAATGSIIPAYLIHAAGNFFHKMAQLFTNEVVMVYTIIGGGVVIALYIVVVEPALQFIGGDR